MGRNEDKKISKKQSSQYFIYFTGICLTDIFLENCYESEKCQLVKV